MDALAALALQIEWGVDEALGHEPCDRRVAIQERVPAVSATATTARLAPVAAPVVRAEALAAGAASRAALRDALAGFDGCALRATASNLVFEAGDPASGIVLVADVPGAAEDRAGAPFAGAAGDFINRMLASIGLSRDRVFATSLVPWRPPGDRKPTEIEVQLCLPFLRRHLALLQPRFVLLMGGLPVRCLLPTVGRRPKGQWHTLEGPGLAATPTLVLGSPAHIMATPSAKRDAWCDLLRLRRALNNLD